MAYLTKNKDAILGDALSKLTATTSITNISPGSIARALTEIITQQLGDFYSILDFNTNQGLVATASGRSFDLLGALYGVNRKTLSDIAIVSRSLGSFYFYLDNPYQFDIGIANGTPILTNTTSFVGQQYTYLTAADTVIPAGRTQVFASIRPSFNNAVFTAGANTLTVIGPTFTQPFGTTVKCTNPKPIEAQVLLESDDNYRARIAVSVRTAAGGTLLSLRMAALNIAGVRDVTFRDCPYGLGSFEALVVSEDNLIQNGVLDLVQTTLDAYRPVGVRMFLRRPNLLPVDVTCSVITTPLTLSLDRANVIRRTESSILRHLNTPVVGTTLVYNQLIQAILDANQVSQDVVITNLAVNGAQVLRKNYIPKSDEQLIPGSIQVSLAS